MNTEALFLLVASLLWFRGGMFPLRGVPYAVLIDDRMLRNLPHGDAVWDPIDTVEPFTFVDTERTGVVMSTIPRPIGGHASSWTQASYTLGSIDMTDLSRGGFPLIYPDLGIAAGIRVTSAAKPIEAASPGPEITVVPAVGSNRWQGEINAGVSPGSGPSREDRPPPIQSLRSWGRVDGDGGGPLTRSGWRLFAAAAITQSSYVERSGPEQLPGDLGSVFAHVTGRIPSSSSIDIVSTIQAARAPFAGRQRLLDRTADQDVRSIAVQGGWKRAAQEAVWVNAGVQSARTSTSVAGDAINGTIERLRDGPVPEIVSRAPGSSGRWTADGGFTFTLGRGRHPQGFRVGGALSHANATEDPIGSGYIGETLNGLPARAWLYGYANTDRWSETIATAYGSDGVSFGAHVALDAGMRIETVRGGGQPNRITWTNVAPRLHLRWTPGDTDRLSVYGALGRYHYQLPLVALGYGDPTGPSGLVYRWTDANGDRHVQTPEVGTLIAVAGPGARGDSSSIDPRLDRPSMDEVLAGVSMQLGGAWSLRFAGIARKERSLVAAVNVGVPPSAYNVQTIFDPGLDLLGSADDQELPVYSRTPDSFGHDRHLLTNPAGLDATYQGLELGLARPVGRLQVLWGATASRSHGPAGNRGFLAAENDQGVLGELDEDPNASTFASGRLFFERGYTMKASGMYAASRWLRFGVVARYEDGQNFARLVIAPDLPQGPEAIRAYANGRSRFTYALTVDGRVDASRRWRAGCIGVAIESFNLLDTKNEVEEDVVTGPSFRTPTAVQPPRVLRMMLRVGF